jgi:hypothetical protein
MLRYLLLLLVLALSSGHAAVTTIASYQLGDADPGAVAGAIGADPTLPSVGTVDLARSGAPVYSADTPAFIGSNLSMRFDGDDDHYAGAQLSTATDNFGIEAWVKSDGNTATNAALAYNGSTSFGGWGLFRAGSNYGFLYGGITIVGVAPLTTEWTHLALVREAGTTRMFVDGQMLYQSGVAPAAPAGDFMIGGNPQLAGEGFDGLIDEVRVFTFEPGEFSIDDLNLSRPPAPLAVPLHSANGRLLLVLSLLLFGLLVLRRFGL